MTANAWPCIVSMDYLSGLVLHATEGSSVITVSSCGANFSKSFQAWKERLNHWAYTCTFVAFLNITNYSRGCLAQMSQPKHTLFTFRTKVRTVRLSLRPSWQLVAVKETKITALRIYGTTYARK